MICILRKTGRVGFVGFVGFKPPVRLWGRGGFYFIYFLRFVSVRVLPIKYWHRRVGVGIISHTKSLKPALDPSITSRRAVVSLLSRNL